MRLSRHGLCRLRGHSYYRKRTSKGLRRGRELDIKDVTGADHALGAQELRALNVLATAGLVAPLRYRPAPVGEHVDAIVAL